MAGILHSLASNRKLPGYLHHKATGQARVWLDGTDYYLGKFGSNASRISVSATHINAVGGIVSPLVKILIDLQRLTGPRSGELFGLNTGCMDPRRPQIACLDGC